MYSLWLSVDPRHGTKYNQFSNKVPFEVFCFTHGLELPNAESGCNPTEAGRVSTEQTSIPSNKHSVNFNQHSFQ